MKKKAKALVLFSGGLDSILAARLLMEQGIEVVPVFFETNFCKPGLAQKAAEGLGLKLRVENMKADFLEVMKKPKFGYGTALNPCIDCHALMLKKAARIMKEENFDLVATGEVLNERPMSQHRQALGIVEKEAGLSGYLLRPLSAKLLDETEPEKNGLVERERLMAISGRSRKEQMALAEKFGIKEYPTPAGGCALTQEGFAGRLKELMKRKPNFNPEDVDLVAIGRHFWIKTETLRQAQGILPERNEAESKAYVYIILGRNKEENEMLEKLAQKGDIILEPEFVGPTALIKNGNSDSIEKAKELIIQFSPKAKKEEIQFIEKKI